MKCKYKNRCKDYDKDNSLCRSSGIYRADLLTGKLVECNKIEELKNDGVEDVSGLTLIIIIILTITVFVVGLSIN